MSSDTIALRPAAEDALSYVESLLEDSGLPAADVRVKPECFYVARRGDDRVGVGGLERYGTDGLLRSIAVEPSERGEGIGTELCDALEAEARTEGVETLYLLTTTASEFFARLGYAEIDRADAPAAIRETDQFDGLCPATATCMAKAL